jgi:hypothetical protein
MAFSFLQEHGEDAKQELVEVLSVLVEIPATEQAKAEAMALYERELTEDAQAEHDRLRVRLDNLRKRELDLRTRLGQMAVALDSAASEKSDAAHSKMAE